MVNETNEGTDTLYIDDNDSATPIINVRDASFRYQGADSDSLRSATCRVAPGECVMLCGQSGCGKTTLTRLLNGLSPTYFAGAFAGLANVAGCEAGKTPIEAYVPLIGSVFQNPKTQYFNTDTTAELAFPCENNGMEPSEIKMRIDKIANAFDLQHLLGHSIFELSGGEKQRIAFAAACMLKPQVLVLDEPTSNLDDTAIAQLRDMITAIKRLGVTIVIAEHRLAWSRDLADRYILIEDGHVTNSWKSAEFQRFSDQQLAQLGLRTLDLKPYQVEVTKKTQYIDSANDNAESTDKDDFDKALISVHDLTIGYRRNRPVAHIENLTLRAGESVALMGHNGCGKSTLAKTLCGLVKPLSGTVQWSGHAAKRRELNQHSFLVMQDVNYQLFSDSVREEVLLSAGEPENCDDVLALLGLENLDERHPMSLSGGQKQRVAIASAMLSGKEFIVLDEPTSGLDRFHMEQVGNMLRRLTDLGKCVLVITHDDELAASSCDRVVRLGL
ncbi:energy-coupling factor ABC transporter ATP-binding protein [Bifidobacterium sp. ESL0732]|uniref:ABC transporter ATP-binding protein n=1 Tax=Bifidobacterium sp. ESL0732 TaxID=2983222 RepID=UPI0023F9764A|nr:energy-coupling factor ABC transporter ATP-binding protein [Bifidobacterium sp. ESL0732]WEV64143.1 energy-coupling factor ABC transporter ATP-binding protein [Bifidobacterium sp. ESL0732]